MDTPLRRLWPHSWVPGGRFLGKGQERKIHQAQHIQVNKTDPAVLLQRKQAKSQPTPMNALIKPEGSAATCRSLAAGSSSLGEDLGLDFAQTTGTPPSFKLTTDVDRKSAVF